MFEVGQIIDESDLRKALDSGCRVSGEHWNGQEMYLKKLEVGEGGEITVPITVLVYVEGSRAYPKGAVIPWTLSATDFWTGRYKIIAA